MFRLTIIPLDYFLNYCIIYEGFQTVKYISIEGIQQRSNKRPLLSLMFINDQDFVLHINRLFFDDDLELYNVNNYIHAIYDLHGNLTRLEEYCIKNRLSLKIIKFKVISFTRQPQPIFYTTCFRTMLQS